MAFANPTPDPEHFTFALWLFLAIVILGAIGLYIFSKHFHP